MSETRTALQQPMHRWEREDDINVSLSISPSFWRMQDPASDKFSLKTPAHVITHMVLRAGEPLHGDCFIPYLHVFIWVESGIFKLWNGRLSFVRVWPSLSSQSPGQPIDCLCLSLHHTSAGLWYPTPAKLHMNAVAFHVHCTHVHQEVVCVCVSEGIWGDVFLGIIYWNILVQWDFMCKQQCELIIMNWFCFFSLLKWPPFDFKMTVKAIYSFYLYISPKFRQERPGQGGVGDLQHPWLKSDTVTVSQNQNCLCHQSVCEAICCPGDNSWRHILLYNLWCSLRPKGKV